MVSIGDRSAVKAPTDDYAHKAVSDVLIKLYCADVDTWVSGNSLMS